MKKKTKSEKCAMRLANALGKKFGGCWKREDGKNISTKGCWNARRCRTEDA